MERLKGFSIGVLISTLLVGWWVLWENYFRSALGSDLNFELHAKLERIFQILFILVLVLHLFLIIYFWRRRKYLAQGLLISGGLLVFIMLIIGAILPAIFYVP